MIVFGSRFVHLLTEAIYGECSYCGTHNSVHLVVFQRYVHVFWIPFFPIGRRVVTECEHCKQVLRKKEFSTEVENKYLALKPKIPLWTFSGLALVCLFIIYLEVVRV